MTEPVSPPKASWTTPELVDLDLSMENVENGIRGGGDGSGGAATSLS